MNLQNPRSFTLTGVVLGIILLVTLGCAAITGGTPGGPSVTVEAASATYTAAPTASRTPAPTAAPKTETDAPTATATVEPTPSETPPPPPTETLPAEAAPTESPAASPAPTESPGPAIAAPTAAPGYLQVHFIDIGQGDAILVRSPEGQTALIDGGPPGMGLVDYLSAAGVELVDLLISTHPHEDHLDGLLEVLEAIPVGRVAYNGQPSSAPSYARFVDLIAQKGIAYSEPRRGETLSLGSLSFLVLHPQDLSFEEVNNNSLALWLGHGQVSFLFMGDVEREAEADLLAAGVPLRARILKVGHHGGDTSSTPEFLAAVQPEFAIYSAEEGNRFGYPHPEVIEALIDVGAQVLGTDRYGTIVVTSDGLSYGIEFVPRE